VTSRDCPRLLKTVHEVTDWLPTVVRGAWPYLEPYTVARQARGRWQTSPPRGALEPYIWPLASTAQTCNVWLVVVLTADRYIAICRPLHAAQYRYHCNRNSTAV